MTDFFNIFKVYLLIITKDLNNKSQKSLYQIIVPNNFYFPLKKSDKKLYHPLGYSNFSFIYPIPFQF